ncbi:hypothetical protein CR513_04817, partial [Mucuna pruriens]
MPFIIHGMEAQGGEHFKKIKHAWKNVIKKGLEGGAKSCRTSPGYRNWLRNRVEQIRLPYSNPPRKDNETLAYDIQKALRAEELKETLGQMESKWRSLKRRLEAALVAQASAEEEVGKEKLKEAIRDFRTKEDELESQLRQVQERVKLLEEEATRERLHKEHLEDQR